MAGVHPPPQSRLRRLRCRQRDRRRTHYSLDIVEVDGQDRYKRGKRGGRKRLVELPDGSRRVVPQGAPVPEGARDVLRPLTELYSPPPEVSALCERVLEQLPTGAYTP